MLKAKFIQQHQIKATLLLLAAALILALLLSFNQFGYSISSTGFGKSNYFYFLKNSMVSIVFNQLGIAVFLIPLVLLIWSYRLFFNLSNNYIIAKLLLLLLVLLIAPLSVFSISGPSNAGILGNFLNTIFSEFNYYYFIISIILLALLIFISGITTKDLLVCLKIIAFLVSFFLNLIYNLVNNLKYKALQYLSNKSIIKSSSKIQQPNASNLSAAFASLDKDVWQNNLSTNKGNNITDNPIKSLNFSNLDNKELETFNQLNFSDLNTSNLDNNNLYNAPELKPSSSKNTANNASSAPPIKSYNVSSYNNYEISTELLDFKEERTLVNSQEIKELALKLEQVIKEFGIEGKIVNIQTGPVVTLFEITIPPGVKTSKVTSLETDIALRMKAFSVRIAVVPGKDVIGIEIPNQKRKTVYLRKLLEHKTFTKSEASLPINLGLDISGKPVVADLATMPHLLVAGTTGSGKSVAVNAMILSLLYKLSPQQCKMIMIDPKMLELSIYQDIPHLLTPVVTDPKKAIYALKWAVKQMEHRYSLMSCLGVRNISSYNQKLKDTAFIAATKASLLERDGFETEFPFMPYIIVIIDEMADLMLVAGKEIEAAVQRLAQMARAAGIHLIMATQRPSVDVITGTIKANFPTRISFQVSSRIDSNTILGDKGAEQLLGKGDMLYMLGVGRLLRVHGPFVSDKEVDKVVTILKSMAAPEYITDVTVDKESSETTNNEDELDELYNEVINLIKEEQKISTSYIQRRFQIGYNRAARIVESLEQNEVISKPSATGKREILIN